MSAETYVDHIVGEAHALIERARRETWPWDAAQLRAEAHQQMLYAILRELVAIRQVLEAKPNA